MQRIKVFGGRIKARQLRGLGQLAGRYTPCYPLHLTTRQDVELHGVRPEDLPALQRAFRGLGLTSIATGGDSLRNITVCPGSGFCRGSWDVFPLASSIQAHAESLPWIRRLPRKFKISISGCPRSCGRPWISDLGLVARPEGTFQAVLAGSLGPRPATGVMLYESLGAAEVLPLVTAALTLFCAEGDRRNRARARLRHVRERLGEADFRRRIEGLLQLEKGRSLMPELPPLRRAPTETKRLAHLRPPLGDIEPHVASELGAVAEAAGAELRIGLDHDLFLYGKAPTTLPAKIRAWATGPSVVACPGAAWCKRGIADSRGAAQRIRSALPGDCRLTVGVAGCPNNCPLAAVADVGLIGRVRREGDDRRECFRLVAGGGKGQTSDLARELHPAVPADQVHEAVARVAEEYEQATQIGRLSFPEFVDRDGTRLAGALSEARGSEGRREKLPV